MVREHTNQGRGNTNPVVITKLQNGIVTLTGTTTVCGTQKTATKQITVVYRKRHLFHHLILMHSAVHFLEAYSTVPATATGDVLNLNFGQVIQDTDGCGSNYFYTASLVTTPQTGLVYYNYLSVQTKNACGLINPSQTISLTVGSVPNNCGGGSIMLRVNMGSVPNSNHLNIAVNTQEIQQNGNGNPEWMQIREVKIYDKFGVMRKRKQFGVGSQQVNIPVQDLPNDEYNVHVANGVHNVFKTILIYR